MTARAAPAVALLAGGVLAACGRVEVPARAEAGAPDRAALPDGQFSATLPNGECIPGAFKQGGECACFGGTPCQNGCPNLAADPENCGACGHACALNAACNRGACGPSPMTVVPGPATCPSPMTLIGEGETVYWTDPVLRAVMRMSTGDCEIQSLPISR